MVAIYCHNNDQFYVYTQWPYMHLQLIISPVAPSFSRAGVANNLLTVQVIGVSSPADAQLRCTFLPFFTGSAHCTVQYGTDPTYMNLPYSAESTEIGTAGDTVSVVLRERLNSSTVYYYTVSAVSGDVTVTVQGTFTTPQYSMLVHNTMSI